MKRRSWIILAAVLAAILMIALVGSWVTPSYQLEKNLHAGKINKMANYLNEKYGYSVSSSHCTYFRSEDYSYHDAFLYGTDYDIPHIAIFDYNGKYITVTDRNGFLGDDAQLEELNGLICDYFEQTLGLRPQFVELWSFSDDLSYNRILFHHYNEKLTAENIAEFMEYIWNSANDYKMLFYFRAEGDLDTQLEEITTRLYALRQYENLKSLRFYVSDMENMIVHYKTPGVHLQTAEENAREPDEGYIWGNYHVINDVEHHYPISEAAVYQVAEFNTFLRGGYCVLNRGYGAAFGNREIQEVNHFGVVDLSDRALAGYLKEMVSYGQYRGHTVLFRAGEDAAVSALTVADGTKYCWDFRWGSGPVELYTCKHGRLMELKTAYDCGYLSPEDMDQILQTHKEYFAQHHSWDYDSVFTE